MIHLAGSNTPGIIGGASPGKHLCGLRVVHYEKLYRVGDGRVIVANPTNPGYARALLRSLIKNFSMVRMVGVVRFTFCIT